MVVAGLLTLSCTQSKDAEIDDNSLQFKKLNVSLDVNKISHSFVYLESTMDLDQQVCDGEENCTNISESIHSALGSGMTIKQKGKTYILTAGHVCAPQRYDPYLQMVSYIGTLSNSINGTGYFGNQSELEIVAIDQQRDLCILKAKSRWVSPGVKLAKRLPESGAEVYMVSAPFGIFEPGLTLVYQGYLAGRDSDDDIMVSMPTRPGTSGSAILDKRGRVIGVIHSAFNMMENVGIGTPIEAVHALFNTIET
tara:strand:- start:1349 stop:2104 length:756 start_codon:yes stop_codon:yes gene_type:complete